MRFIGVVRGYDKDKGTFVLRHLAVNSMNMFEVYCTFCPTSLPINHKLIMCSFTNSTLLYIEGEFLVKEVDINTRFLVSSVSKNGLGW